MKKLLLISLIVILLGLGYFAWQSNQVSNVNNPETKSQTEVINIVNDSSNNLDVKIDENKNKSEAKEGKEKVVINTVTGENVPEGFYDEILADGYTYNNPKPIPENWIIESAGDGYPATIDYYKFFDEASESQTLPGKIGSKTAIPDYMYGYSQRAIYISFKSINFEKKNDFSKWFNDKYNVSFVFIKQSNLSNQGGKSWAIFINDELNFSELNTLVNDMKSEDIAYIFNKSLYLPKYRGTDELKKFREINKNSGLF